jgi:UDP-glucose 4-epimerase
MQKKQKILVTGGAGYIGSHILPLLQNRGDEVWIIDNLSTGFKQAITYGNLEVIDLAHHQAMLSFFEKHQKIRAHQPAFDAVIHFAGSIVVPESVANPQKYYTNNTLNSQNLISLCLKFEIPHFIFSSTAAVYGLFEGGECHENTPTVPINPYGRSKLMTEWMLQDSSFAHPHFQYAALRYFNVAGAHNALPLGQRNPDATHLIKVSCQVLTQQREQLSIFGKDYSTLDGTCIRDYIHVMDLVDAHICALDYLQEKNQSFVANIGIGRGASVLEVVESLQRVTHLKMPYKFVERRAGDPDKLIANSDWAKSFLKWSPQFTDLDKITASAFFWEQYWLKHEASLKNL